MNEEIELILKKLKIVSEAEEPGAYICDKEHSKILLKEIERLRKLADFLTDEYNKKKAARNYVIANAELFDDFICTGDNFEIADLLEIFDTGDKKC